MRGSAAIAQIKAADEAETALGRPPPPLVLISCTGNAADPTVAQDLRRCGAHATWSKPFPSFTTGQMQREVATLLDTVGRSQQVVLPATAPVEGVEGGGEGAGGD